MTGGDDVAGVAREWQPIATAPRTGEAVEITADGVVLTMCWNPTGTNALFAPGKVGLWEAPDRSLTWSDVDDCGPTHWRPLPVLATSNASEEGR